MRFQQQKQSVVTHHYAQIVIEIICQNTVYRYNIQCVLCCVCILWMQCLIQFQQILFILEKV